MFKALPSAADVVILGAGCSGMSLAYYLLLGHFPHSVLIMERNDALFREQRWCSWGPLESDIAPFASKRWSRFVVTGPGARFDRPTSEGYWHVYAPDFLNGIAQRLETAGNFILKTGVDVLKVQRDDSGSRWTIRTNEGSVTAKQVYDARNLRDCQPPQDSPTPWMYQSFAGMTITASSDVFDPSTVTLMDFDVPGGDKGAFVYVLPYSKRAALVESTLISVRLEDRDHHLERARWYIDDRLRTPVIVESIETGVVPMTPTPFPTSASIGRYFIGILGGAAKPSTGYAFARIQRQTKQIASELIACGIPQCEHPSSAQRRRAWLDDVFLTASAKDERFFTCTVLSMAERLPPDLLIRFLSENNSLADDLKVMSAVGNKELAEAAATVAGRPKF